jgi:hypothetical protein
MCLYYSNINAAKIPDYNANAEKFAATPHRLEHR